MKTSTVDCPTRSSECLGPWPFSGCSERDMALSWGPEGYLAGRLRRP